MCYMVILSTDSEINLSKYNDKLVQYSKDMPGLSEESYLKYQNMWFVTSQHTCSCGFRHMHFNNIDSGFGVPENWCPEEAEDLESTLEFIQTIRNLLNSGAKVDCIDVWDSQDGSGILSGVVDVDLSSIKDEEFRFYENCHFIFS